MKKLPNNCLLFSIATVSYIQDKRINNNSTMQAVYNVTKLLDGLLSNYDSSLRPDFGGKRSSIFGKQK